MIRTENLSFHYNQEQSDLRFPDITLSEREDLLVLGKSGIGKTTLLHLLAGLLTPSTGSVSVNDTNIHSLSSSKLDQFRGTNIGLVFQKNHAVQSLSVLENIQARLYFSKAQVAKNTIEELLQDLGLQDYKHRKVNELSLGQLQRLGIGLAVVHNPKVILADEPTSSLDDENCSIVIDLLKKQAEKNNAHLIVITHDHRIKPFFQNSLAL